MNKRQKQLSLSLIITLFYTTSAYTQTPSFSDIIISRFSNPLISELQEKIYVQTDKPYYSAGENIWFKAYLVNAITLMPNALSRFVYVELINKQDSVISRVKIRTDSLGFAGHLKLNPEIPTGHYMLRAYTYWMQNTEIDFFFKKNILIGNKIDNRVVTKVNFGSPAKGLMSVEVTFTNASNSPIVGQKVEIAQNWKNSDKRKFNLLTDKDGKIEWQIKVDSNDVSKKSISISMDEEKFKNTLSVPDLSSDFDVQFFPESGILLNDILQIVAFKAIKKNGLSTNITLRVFNNKDEEIVNAASFHKGMGKFSLQAYPNENYYAIVKNEAGIEKRIDLPKSLESGVVLRLVYNKGKIRYEVTNKTSLPDKSLYLLVHTRGKVNVIQSLTETEGQISESSLRGGINSFSVIDSLGHTYCERLAFVRNFKLPVVTMESDKLKYSKREAVSLNLNVKTLAGEAVKGNFSISITDSYTVKHDSLADNILTNLLLTSDIQGYVEDPANYFVDSSIATRERTDLLMLTQGWRRFKTDEVVKSVFKKPEFYMEMSQALSGTVKNIMKTPVKKCEVIAISPYKNSIRMSKTDSLGRFLIDGLEFPDSTSFALKANKSKGITDVEIIPDEDKFPDSKVFIPCVEENYRVAEKEEYFQQSKEKYYYEGGVRVVNLSEVTVNASKEQSSNKSYYAGLGDSKVTTEQLKLYQDMSLLDLFLTIPGVQVNEDKISIRGSSKSPLVLIDDIEMQDISELSFLTAHDLVSIDVFKGVNTLIFGSRGANGVIAISLKKGEDRKTAPPISLAHVMPLGYQKYAEFYVPKYQVDSIYKSSTPDLRTTIYWNPKLSTDSNGNAHINFYSADKSNDYTVIVEGVSTAGDICRYVGIIRRENK